MVKRYNFEHCCGYEEVKNALQGKVEIAEWLKDSIEQNRIIQKNDKVYIDDKEMCPGAWLLLENYGVLTIHDCNNCMERS